MLSLRLSFPICEMGVMMAPTSQSWGGLDVMRRVSPSTKQVTLGQVKTGERCLLPSGEFHLGSGSLGEIKLLKQNDLKRGGS